MAENYFGITDTGKMRTNNEDTFFVEPVLGNTYVAACVIDGVGGYEGGEVAAALAREAILHHLQSHSAVLKTMLIEALGAANLAIYKEKQQSGKNDQMACVVTLALIDFNNNKLYYAHVGDTRMYLLRDNSLVKVTRDHSFVGFLEDSGRLTEEAAMRHPKRNEINKALGFDVNINLQEYLETGESPFLPGDMVMLCSDGLTDLVDNKTMTSVLTDDEPLPTKAKTLVRIANDEGGKDNITVVLVYNDKPLLKHTPTKPSAFSKKSDIPAAVSLKETATVDAPVFGHSPKKKSKGIVSLLLFFVILLLGVIGWLVYQNYMKKEARIAEALNNNTGTLEVRTQNEQEKALADSISSSTTGEVFIMNTPGSPPVMLSDSISINKDSLHIIGNGVVIGTDTLFKGPALIFSSQCRYILLDSMSFENFDIAILSRNQSLHLKNVQFRNCRIPVHYQLQSQDQPKVNGRYADTLFKSFDVTNP